MTIKENDTVEHEFLGRGRVQKVWKNVFNEIWAADVLYEQTPPVKYNMGGNPAFSLIGDLTVIEEEND